jgi:hypothetical protein
MDLSMTEDHSSDIQVTEHPVEVGSDVTDNARPKPDMLTVEGFISETPFDGTGAPYWGNYDPSRPFDTTKGFSFPRPEMGDDFLPLGRAKAAFDLLRLLKDNSTPLSITTSLHYYPTMLIENLHFPRDPQIGDSLKISIKFRAVRFVNSDTAKVSVKSARDQGKAKKGPKPAKKVADADRQSELDHMAEGAVKNGKVARPLKGTIKEFLF